MVISRLSVWTIARLTLREASRRKLLLALFGLTVAIVVLTGWGFSRLPTIRDRDGLPLSAAEVRLIAANLLILVAFMFSGVLALGSVFIAAPAVASDIESGIILAVLPRPLRRAELVLGKWLGLAILVTAYAVISGGLELLAVWLAVGYVPPNPAFTVILVSAEGLVLMTLALLLSTRLAPMTGGIIALVGFFTAWIGGIAAGLGETFDNRTIASLGIASRVLVPSDGLWRDTVYSLEPDSLLHLARGAGRAAAASPFLVVSPLPLAFSLWVAVWLVGVLGLAVWSFSRRDL